MDEVFRGFREFVALVLVGDDAAHLSGTQMKISRDFLARVAELFEGEHLARGFGFRIGQFSGHGDVEGLEGGLSRRPRWDREEKAEALKFWRSQSAEEAGTFEAEDDDRICLEGASFEPRVTDGTARPLRSTYPCGFLRA